MKKTFGALAALVLHTAVQAQSPALATYPLPASVTYPEGVAYDAKTNAIFTGSAATGNIVRIDLKSRQSTDVTAAVLPAEPFPALLGMKVDGAGRLWLAGGRTGAMAVVDARSGALIKKFEVPTKGASLINDVAIVGDAAYFTDSLTPTMWRVSTAEGKIGDLEPWLQFAGTPLEYTTPGANLNGITATEDGRTLLVVQMNKGLLFRIDIAGRKVSPIDIGGESVATGDGLVLDRRRLYVVRQGEQEIVTIDLADDLTRGKVVSRFKDPALAWPATAAKVGDNLLVVNTQFNKRTTKDAVTPFSIVAVPLSRLGGK
jgi:sugar lactone lactonase YvrE